MARPTKQGIDYYPLDVQFDDKVELFIAETGAEGLGILITIWQLIYQNEGYYVQHNDDLILLIRRRIMADIDQISLVISCAISRGIFSESLHKKHKILTSSAIQKRYFIGAKKKKIVSVVKNYITIDVSDVGNLVYVDGNATKEEVKEKEEVEEEEDEKGKGKDTGGKPPKKTYKDLDYSSWPSMPKPEVLADWMEVRRKKKAANTQTAINGIGKQLHEAAKSGFTVDQCIEEAVTRSWSGFKVEWMKNTNNGFNQPQQAETKSKRALPDIK